jgi:hypothetical protein
MTILASLVGDSKPFNLFVILSSNAEHTSSGVAKISITTQLPYICWSVCLSVRKYNTIGDFKIIDIYCHSAGSWEVLDQGSPDD